MDKYSCFLTITAVFKPSFGPTDRKYRKNRCAISEDCSGISNLTGKSSRWQRLRCFWWDCSKPPLGPSSYQSSIRLLLWVTDVVPRPSLACNVLFLAPVWEHGKPFQSCCSFSQLRKEFPHTFPPSGWRA